MKLTDRWYGERKIDALVEIGQATEGEAQKLWDLYEGEMEHGNAYPDIAWHRSLKEFDRVGGV